MKTPTQLRIVKRDGLFVVQIRKQRFWTRRWWWQDIVLYYIENNSTHLRFGGGYTPTPQASFKTLNEASIFCDEYLTEERSKNNPDVEVKTYNTGLDDRHWPPPLSHKPPPPPPPRNIKGTYTPPKNKIPPPPPDPPSTRIIKDGVWINKPTKGDDDE